MCGIAGYAGQGEREDLERMIRSLKHRGPDDTGIYAEPGIGLAHARLSIIDLTSAGHEPMWNTRNDTALIFNGEIYNYRELREEYCSSYSFKGESDAEVVLALYDRFGEECFQYLQGMFAIALWDSRKKTLVLARDRMGKKPLYYAVRGETLIFGSEPKALLEHPLVLRELDMQALGSYLALDYVPTPHCIWKGVHKLAPATLLSFKEGKSSTKKFWQPSLQEVETSLDGATQRLDAELSRATASRLVSDVPLGVFLSGGLDSSTVAYYAQQASTEPLHTFSIGFSEKSFDESKHAELVAKSLGTVHHALEVRAEDGLAILPEILANLDEPLADASLIPTALLARFAREHVTVALGGDGADELFAGYSTFLAERLVKIIPSALVRATARLLPRSDKYMSLGFKLEKFLDGGEEKSPAARHMRWLGTFSPEEQRTLLSKQAYEAVHAHDPYSEAMVAYAESDAKEEGNKLLSTYQRSYMMDEVLVKVDRASMQYGLEVRAPFLDYKLVEFVNRLPYAYKLHGLTHKYLLKHLMRGKLPDSIVHRSKKGFGVPVSAWLRGPLRNWVEVLLAEDALRARGIFDPAAVRKLWQEHLEGKRDHRKKLWNILMFRAWEEEWLS